MRKRIAIWLLCAGMAASPAITTAPVFAAEPAQEYLIASNDDSGGSSGFVDTPNILGVKDGPGITVSNSDDEYSALSLFLSVILYIAQLVGISLVIWGIFKFFESIQCDHPNAKKQAFTTMSTGVFLIGLTLIFKAIGYITVGGTL